MFDVCVWVCVHVCVCVGVNGTIMFFRVFCNVIVVAIVTSWFYILRKYRNKFKFILNDAAEEESIDFC